MHFKMLNSLKRNNNGQDDKDAKSYVKIEPILNLAIENNISVEFLLDGKWIKR